MRQDLCRSRSRIGAALFWLMLLLIFSVPCIAQQSSVVSPAFKRPYQLDMKAAGLDEIIRHIAAETHINILVDGVPIKRKCDLEATGTLAEILDRLGNEFDYDWREIKGDVVLMTKRFANPDERPQIILPEARLMVQELDQLLNFLPGDPDPTQHDGKARNALLARELLDSLTPEQMAIQKTRGSLHANNLSPEQVDLMGRMMLATLFDRPHLAIRQSLALIDALINSRLSVNKVNIIFTT